MYRDDEGSLKIGHKALGDHYCYSEGKPHILFCENETNTQRLYNYAKEGTAKDASTTFSFRATPMQSTKVTRARRLPSFIILR